MEEVTQQFLKEFQGASSKVEDFLKRDGAPRGKGEDFLKRNGNFAQIVTWEGGEGWTPSNVPRCWLYVYQDGTFFVEWGKGRQRPGSRRPAAANLPVDGHRGPFSPGIGRLRDLAAPEMDTASERAQQSASLAKRDGETVGLAAMAATAITCARGCPPGAVALCAAAATLLGVSAATFWVARSWRGRD